MLVLSRHPGTDVCIGKDIRIKVLDFSRGQVILGIEAPRELQIWREPESSYIPDKEGEDQKPKGNSQA